MKNRFGVAGSPIQHSLSPAIHQAAYSHLGLDFSYDRFEVRQGELGNFLDDEALSGLSVTMPLKDEAFELATERSSEAAKTGVVNTLIRTSDGLVGHNTDVVGFKKCFSKVSIPTAITLIGSGATSRSAALALSEVFPGSNVAVMGRTSQSVLNLVDLVRSYGLNAHVANLDASALASSDLVVSTVPGSALADLWEEVSTITIGEHATLFDVAYEPWPSLASKAWGPKCISGLEMLIWQGIEQVKLFANSQNYLVKATDSELYGVMKASVAE